jgi:hypothetical protein
LFLSCGTPSGNGKASPLDTDRQAKTSAADTLKHEIFQQIQLIIQSGFYEKEETIEIIRNTFTERPVDENWLSQEIDKRLEAQLKAQSAWPAVTDFDKLATVFDKLNASGIIALHNTGYTREDGEGDTQELHDELSKKGIRTYGYCFYHTQDMDRAIKGGNLLLAFGDFKGNDETGAAIGRQINNALQDAGFKTKWNFSVDSRIEITGFAWQKRFGNDRCSYERAVTLLMKPTAR